MFWSEEKYLLYKLFIYLLRWDSFLGTQGKQDLIIPKINIVSEFNLIDTDTRPMRTVNIDQQPHS